MLCSDDQLLHFEPQIGYGQLLAADFADERRSAFIGEICG